MKRQTQEQIRKEIMSDAVNKTVNPEKQAVHYRNSSGYIQGRSYLLPSVDAQELVDRYHGTGEIDTTRKGAWRNKEFVEADTVIGVDIDPESGKTTLTNRFTIHYSKTGTHAVPAERR